MGYTSQLCPYLASPTTKHILLVIKIKQVNNNKGDKPLKVSPFSLHILHIFIEYWFERVSNNLLITSPNHLIENFQLST